MRRKHFMSQTRILYIFWSFILIGALYLVIRFAMISFSNDVGQATGGMKESIISTLCERAMKSGSGLLSYTLNKKETTLDFPISLVEDGFVLDDFIKDISTSTVMASEYVVPEAANSIIAQTLPVDTGEEVTQTLAAGNLNKPKVEIYPFNKAALAMNYILTNGAILDDRFTLEEYQVNDQATAVTAGVNDTQLQVGILEGDIEYVENDEKNLEELASIEASANKAVPHFTMEQLYDSDFLVRTFYNVDQETSVSDSLFDAKVLLAKDMTIKHSNEAPQILIYHTHSQEAFADSREGVEADTVVGMGEYLAKILEDKYGYNVIHDKSCYDVRNGVLDRNKAYNYARAGIEKILEENPTIEVVIDLHRDGVAKRSTVLDGEETAQIMLFNGLCRDQYGPLTRYDNPNLEDNLAFSLQLKLKSLELYPTLLYKNYLHAYRYNQHLRKKSILMELGTYKNTVQSARNAMEPFADILNAVLQGEE